VAAIDEREARAAGIGPLGRYVDDSLALKLLLNVQKYSLWFHDFSHADMRKMQHGNPEGEYRLLVTRFEKGDYIMRKGEAATFLAILLQGELGVRIGKGGGFPRRLHKGALFGERGMFNAGNLRAADVIALSGTRPQTETHLTFPPRQRLRALALSSHRPPSPSPSPSPAPSPVPAPALSHEWLSHEWPSQMAMWARCCTRSSSCLARPTPSS